VLIFRAMPGYKCKSQSTCGLAIALLAVLTLSSACTSDDPEFIQTHRLIFQINATEAAAQMAKEESQSTDPVTWSVRCTSLDEKGGKTTSVASYDDKSDKYEIDSIPADVDTVCHLLDEEGALVSTMSVNDSGALGGVRDVFRLRKDAWATIIHDTELGISVAHSGDFTFTEPEERADLEGRWDIGCKDVRDVVTDEVAQELQCSDEIQDIQLFLHRVLATGPNGERRTAYGVWRSEEAFAACGRTEGVEWLPFGWSLEFSSTLQSERLALSAPFDGLTATTTSAEIMDMIRSCDVEGIRSYDQFAEENEVICADESKCVMYYYYEMRRHGVANSGSLCWPQLIFTFDDAGEARPSLWAETVGSVKPLGRIHFVEAFEYGNETYMRHTTSQTRVVYVQSQPVECKLKEEFLIAVEIPDLDEDGSVDVDEDDSEIEAKGMAEDDDLIFIGTQLEAKYHSSIKVVSTEGIYDNLCRQELGKEDAGSEPGFYSDVVLESITAL
jgi:hypothetical protein